MKKLLALLLIAFALPAAAQYSTADVLNLMWAHDPVNIIKGTSLYPTRSMVHVYGYNGALAATYETITPQSTIQKYINYGIKLDVVAASASDDTSGTGIQDITITGLDSNWAYQSETVTLAGGETVQTTNKFVRVFSVIADTAGTGGVAAGNISIQNTSNDTTLALIPIGETRAYNGIFTVPAGKTFYIRQFYAASASSVLIYASVWERKYGSGVWIERDAGEIYVNGFDHLLTFPLPFQAKSDIEIRAKGNTGILTAAIIGWYE